jgi:hypothetical protein
MRPYFKHYLRNIIIFSVFSIFCVSNHGKAIRKMSRLHVKFTLLQVDFFKFIFTQTRIFFIFELDISKDKYQFLLKTLV